MNELSINNVWMMICIALVFFMHLGFSLLEIGLTRQKNAINVLLKNIFIITSGLLLYYIVGFGLMYPGDFNGLIGLKGFFLNPPLNVDGSLNINYNPGYTYWTEFLFQGMFAATAATIVSGAVAERIKIEAFMIFVILYVGLIYPIAGSWKWGGGFLQDLSIPFYDFAGSTLVHSVGGWAALVAVFLLGPRIGKFKNNKVFAIQGHNIPLATMGVLILWFGWFGFNGGSVLSADPALTSITLVTTSLAAATGGIISLITSRLLYKNLDLTMFLNGILGGLVAITAGADIMSPMESLIIGGIAGPIVVLGISILDNLNLDDPVGAISVHLFCGVWGTLSVGLFGSLAGWNQFISQLIGVACYATICLASSFIIFYVLKKTIGLRVSERHELEGLDLHEHGMNSYPDFRLNEH